MLIEIFSSGKSIIKKRREDKSFSIIDVKSENIGFYWLISRDYSNLINDPAIFKNSNMKVVELDIVNLENYPENISQMYKLNDILGNIVHKYAKVYYEDAIKFNNFSTFLSDLNKIGITRIQLDMTGFNINNIELLSKVSQLNVLCRKFGITLNSCKSKDFEHKNMWLGNEPCISGALVKGLVGTKMLTIRNNEDCYCHKYTDILGCGEIFRQGIDKVRNSDIERFYGTTLKKIVKVSDAQGRSKKTNQPIKKDKVRAKKKDTEENVIEKLDLML